MSILKLAIFSTLLVGCIHTNSSDTKKEAPEIALPSWVNQDCFLSNGYYYFVGYGEGQNASSAVRNALITSRQNALTCLFGGTVTSKITLDESNESIDFSGHTSVTLSYQHVNWSGYEQVSGKVFYASKEKNRIYGQYRWSQNAIKSEQERLKKLSEKIEETNALKNEIEIKKEIIDDQRERLAELNRQEEELQKLKKASDKAVRRLQQMQESRKEKSRDILKVISNLYCGITVDQLIDVFREPDRAEPVATGEYRYVSYVAFSWDQYQIRVGYEYIRSRLGDWPKVGEMDNTVVRIAKDAPVKFIYSDFGLTRMGYDICKK